MDTRDFDDFTNNDEKSQRMTPNGFQEGSSQYDDTRPPTPLRHLGEETGNVNLRVKHHGLPQPHPLLYNFHFDHQPSPPPPEKHGKGPLQPGQNSLILETLSVISEEVQDITGIAKIINEIGPEAISLFENIRARNITDDPKLFIQLMIAEEKFERVKTRAVMANYIKRRKAIVLLPLPPYLLDSIKPLLVPELVFETEKRIQAHIKPIAFRNLNMNTLAEVIEEVDEIEAVIMDGQFNPNELFIRNNAAPLVKIMLYKQLKKIFLHKIPHRPRDEYFICLNLSENEVEVTSI